MSYLPLGQSRQQQQPQPGVPQQKYPDLKQDRKAIEAFVTRHYDKDNRALNLSNLSAFLPKVKSINFNDKRFAILLESILAVSCPDIISLGLDKNNISKLGAVSYLLHNRLKIINLSLESNKISNFGELDILKDVDLRELVLSQNPVCNGKDELSYQTEVVRKLPGLFILDNRQVKGEDNHPNAQIPAIMDNFFGSENIRSLSGQFLSKYYEAFDGDRNSLVAAYDEHAQFSLSHLPTSQPKGRYQSSFRDMFAAYTPLDRNLNTQKSTDKRVSTLKTGPTHIVGTLMDLPSSQHDLSSFTCDSFVTNIGFEMLTVSIQGSFVESTKKKRSFSRVFILIPAPTNTKHEGWPFVIVNDQFYIRNFTQKRLRPPQPQVPAEQPQIQQPQPPSPTEEQQMQELIIRFAGVSKMILPVCKECLANNQWNFDKALNDFHTLLAGNKILPEWMQQ